MAFIPQNGWCLIPPAWGECHVCSMAVCDQVCQPHRVHVALLRPGHLQGPSELGRAAQSRVPRRLRPQGPALRFHQEHRAPVFRSAGRTRPGLGAEGGPHVYVPLRSVPQGRVGPSTHPRPGDQRRPGRHPLHPGNLSLVPAGAGPGAAAVRSRPGSSGSSITTSSIRTSA